jgi:predicted ATPase
MTEQIRFGEWLRKQHLRLDLSRQALAAQAGCAEVTLRRIEAGNLKPSRELALILLEKLGIPEAERPKWVLFSRGLADFPDQDRSSDGNRSGAHLPAALTSFIGHEKDQARVLELIRENRLVTLTGSGGVGKTRLALEVGGALPAEFSGGVFLVELASLQDGQLLAQTIAAQFGIVAESNASFTDLLISFLQEKSLLIILDNCEHLLAACAQMAGALLKACRGLKILATSREALGLVGEAAFLVPSLALPDLQDSAGGLAEVESMRLFAARARLARTDFSLDALNLPVVAEICCRLDGIPLALELAAARLEILQVDEILEQLNDCFDILAGSRRGIFERQQTMRASIDWSWSLLSQAEQAFMRQVCVFAGGWTLESAQAVCDGNILELTSALVRKSLIVTDPETGRKTRFRLHEIIRQYMQEKLAETGGENTLRLRHLHYFLKLSEAAEPALNGPTQMEWQKRLKDELDNLRAALEYAGRVDTEAGLWISGRLNRFWSGSMLREGMRWLQEFLQKVDSKTYSLARAKALLALGRKVYFLEDFASAESEIREALDLYQTSADLPGEIDALSFLGPVLHSAGRTDMEIFHKALSLSQSLQDPLRQAYVYEYLSYVWPDYPRRIAYLKKAIRLYRKVGDWNSLASNLTILAKDEALSGDLDSAQRRLEEAVELNRKFNMRAGATSMVIVISRIYSMQGDFETGRKLLEDNIAEQKEFGYRMEVLWLRSQLGALLLRKGEIDLAGRLLADTANEFYEDGFEIGAVFAVEGVAGVNSAMGKYSQAARLIGWADAMRKKVGDMRPSLEQADVNKVFEVCLANLGEAAFSDAYDEGQAMTTGQAMAYL